jgi:hypothetical protein
MRMSVAAIICHGRGLRLNRSVLKKLAARRATLPFRRLDDDPAHGYDVCDLRGKTCF